MSFTGTDNEYLHMVITLSEGPIEGVEAVYLDEKLSTDFGDKVYYEFFNGSGLQGVCTTLPFFERMLSDERFVSGEIDVGFVDRHWMEEMASRPVEFPELFPAALAAAAAAFEEHEHLSNSNGEPGISPSPWKLAGVRALMRGRS